nr:(d)CMP kinase [Clostridia bacterium]
MKSGEIINIAIDGPASSGKSTAAKNLARLLEIEYIDTGAMYRAVALKALKNGIPLDDDEGIEKMLAGSEIDFEGGKIFLDGEDVSSMIRTLECSRAASQVSKLPSCRRTLADLQRGIASRKSIVMDGRDIGTNVLPDAKFKFFMNASAEKRAERRCLELQEKGQEVSYDEVLRDIVDRDREDTTRKLNPL